MEGIHGRNIVAAVLIRTLCLLSFVPLDEAENFTFNTGEGVDRKYKTHLTTGLNIVFMALSSLRLFPLLSMLFRVRAFSYAKITTITLYKAANLI
jgi:hypothetical protein